jgi:drug/metabolite transporter (DMT)-like permease
MAYFRAMIAINSPRRKAYLYMHLSIILWGLTGVLGRRIILNEGLLVWYRMLITVVSMYLFIVYTGKSLKIARTELLKLIGIGIVLTVHWLFFYGSIEMLERSRSHLPCLPRRVCLLH